MASDEIRAVGKVESALRIFGADRALLLIEGVTIAKVVLWLPGPLRLHAQERCKKCSTKSRNRKFESISLQRRVTQTIGSSATDQHPALADEQIEIEEVRSLASSRGP